MATGQTIIETLASRGDEPICLRTTRGGVLALAQLLRLVGRNLIANAHRLHNVIDLAERIEQAATSGQGQITIETGWPALIFEIIDEIVCPSHHRDIRPTIWHVTIENHNGATTSFSARTIVGLYQVARRSGQILPDGAIEWCSKSAIGEMATWVLNNRIVRIEVKGGE